MNALASAINKSANKSHTENGSPTRKSSKNSCVDLFFMAPAMRGQGTDRLYPLVNAAISDDMDLALRTLLWIRDIRGGSGERQIFKDSMRLLETRLDTNTLKKVMNKIPEVGRWDDLFVFETQFASSYALKMIRKALVKDRNGLCAKWMPRPSGNGKELAKKIYTYMKMSPKEYRKLIVELTNVVETKMCDKSFDQVEYSKIPSLAMTRYRKAFYKNDQIRFEEFNNAILQKDPKVKINTGAVYPYDVLKGVSQGEPSSRNSIQAMWNNLPDYVPEDAIFLPMVDVSGSMNSSMNSSINKSLTCLDVAVSLGLYLCERNKSAFKDQFMTFSSDPKFVKVSGDVVDRCNKMVKSDWGFSTNLDYAMDELINFATKNKVKNKEMPNFLIILSDMEFDCGYPTNKKVSTRVKKMFKDSKYKMPKIIWWNIQSRHDNVPVKSDSLDMALVAGFSPAIVKSVLSTKNVTPLDVLLETVMIDRYKL